MKSDKSFFKLIDDKIIQWMDIIKTNVYYENFISYINTLNDIQRTIIIRIISIVILFIPIVPLLIIILSSISDKTDINIRKKIKEEIIKYTEKKKNIEMMLRDASPNYLVNNKNELEKKIKNILKILNIPERNITINKFNLTSSSPSYNKVFSEISYFNMSTKDLASLLGRINLREKIRINQITINRNNNNTLNGIFNIELYSKVN